MKNVAIGRLQLFKPSETFIADQARGFTEFLPTLVGRELHGAPPPDLVHFTPKYSNKINRLQEVVFPSSEPYQAFFKGRVRPDLFHSHFGVDALSFLPLVRHLDVPHIITFHGFDATVRKLELIKSASPSWVRYALFSKRLASSGALFICVSEFIKSKVLSLGFPPDKVVVHYIGTDLQAFSELNRCKAARPTVLHVARLVEKKGTIDLLKAMAIVKKSVPDVLLKVVGDGPLKVELRDFVEANGLSDIVEFLGVQPHTRVKEELSSAWAFCLPSVTASNGDTEGLPISIIEAQAAGVPVIATVHSGIPEAVHDGVTGLLVNERDFTTLADRLTSVLKDNSLADILAHQAKVQALARFERKNQSKKLEELYLGVI